MINYTLKKSLFVCAFLLFLVFLPNIISELSLNLVITMLIYSLFAIAFNILFGQAGLLSFGHAAFYGTGAFTSLLMYNHFGFSLFPGILAGGVTCIILGVVFGAFVTRAKGMTFALLSLAFNMLIFSAAEKWRGLTGGEDGISCQRPDLFIPGLGSINMFPTENYYYFVLTIVTLCIVFCWYFTKTPLGRINVGIRENDQRAAFVGFNVYMTKFIVYLVCAFFCGIAGALASTFSEFASTSMMSMAASGDILITTFVGGKSVFWGPVLGAVFLTYLNDTLSSITEHWVLVKGTIFIVLVMYAPEGIGGLLLTVKNRIYNRLKQKRTKQDG